MLIKYRADYKKIALGLLSYVPGLRNIQHLEAEFSWYESKSTRELLLWRDKDEHFTAIIGIEHIYGVVLLRHISIIPAQRNGELVFKVLNALQQYQPDKLIMGTIACQKIINTWRNKNEQRTPNQVN